MNKHLAKALMELEDAKALGVPTPYEIMKAKDSSTWSGALHGNGDWKLIKHGKDSYTTNTRKNI